MTALIKAGFMSVWHSLEERMEFWRPGNSRTMMCMGGTEHGLGICLGLDSCGIGVWFGTFGVAALMSCTSMCVFCCISRNFALGGRSVTLLVDHGTTSPLMFGLTKATQPPRKMKEGMR